MRPSARSRARLAPVTDSPAQEEIDFDLHGLAGVRLIGASPTDMAVVGRQLGLVQASLDREPDIVIRFVDHLAIGSRIRYVGVGEAAFTDDAFLVLRSKHKAPARVEIAFTQIGQSVEIVCEHGLPAVPFLIPILNLTVLARGVLPLHASAFVNRGTGVVATGWTKGGKTEALLAFAARGAEYVGDEWVYVTADGSRVHGIPEPIRIWGWHMRQLPQYEALISRADRTRLRAIELFLGAERALRRVRPARGPAGAMTRLAPLLNRQLLRGRRAGAALRARRPTVRDVRPALPASVRTPACRRPPCTRPANNHERATRAAELLLAGHPVRGVAERTGDTQRTVRRIQNEGRQGAFTPDRPAFPRK
jgi:hypothetical protein